MVSGIILAGGKGRSMRQRNKALMPCEGETMLERQIRIMSELCQEIIIATDSPRSYLPLVSPPIRIVSDYLPGRGPLSGLAAGLSLSRQRYAWVVGCDMPNLSAASARLMLKRLIGRLEAVWPSDKDGPHPLHGVYDCECAPRIAALVEEGTATIADLPLHLEWGEVAEGEFVQNGIAYDFLEHAGGEAPPIAPFADEKRWGASL
ncbi:molybdenum cofactor guanylyltransferase [Cohnella sp. AR92]|uniref:molybdenum cofactor guanylyltransferase n=1 Tax=Cohnella sp. AR92 TaxID=648716 RepID=UPI00131527A6|nr:molybdenum cofactor guanylyltransferase [Cohnella sp. AR92]